MEATHLHVERETTTEYVQALVSAMTSPHACRGCGLVGFDLHLAGPDAAESPFAEIAGRPGLRSMEVAGA